MFYTMLVVAHRLCPRIICHFTFSENEISVPLELKYVKNLRIILSIEYRLCPTFQCFNYDFHVISSMKAFKLKNLVLKLLGIK